jgi:hypothetical protein
MTDDLILRERGKAHADLEVPAARPGTPGHAEWMIDEAIQESFPASDSPTPVRPGSIAAERYGKEAARRHRRRTTMRAVLWCAAIGSTIAAVRTWRASRERSRDLIARL